MLDREKVIKGLKCCVSGSCNECPYQPDGLCDNTMMQDALTMLKMWEPVRPRWTHPTIDESVMMCGCCGIAIPLGKPNYCPWCGRKVKWG